MQRFAILSGLSALLALSVIGCGPDGADGTGAGGGSGGGEGSGGTSIAGCEECSRITNPYCAASDACSEDSDGLACEWGLIGDWTTCESSQALSRSSLPVDCRLPKNSEDPRCDRTFYDLPSQTLGSGMSSAHLEFSAGFVDAPNNRAVLTFRCDGCTGTNSGVMGVDLTTGDRTLLSGAYEDPLQGTVTAGGGELPTSLDHVLPGPNGKWLALDNIGYPGAAEILEIDPTTGDRTILYDDTLLENDPGGICTVAGYPLQVARNNDSASSDDWANLVLEPDGTIYVRANVETESFNTEALVRLKDGACTVVTAYSLDTPESNVGEGAPLTDTLGWLIDDGDRILSVTSRYFLVAISKATGQRTVVSSSYTDAPLGQGPDLGIEVALMSKDGKKLYTDGPNTEGGPIIVDLATGDRESVIPIGTQGPIEHIDGPQLWHPTLDGVLVVAIEGGVALFEPATGNFNNLSR